MRQAVTVREGELVSQVKDVHHKLLTALEHRHRCGQVVAASIRHTIDGARTAVSQEGSVGVVVAREELRASLAFQWDVIVGVREGVCGVMLDGVESVRSAIGALGEVTGNVGSASGEILVLSKIVSL